MIDCVLDKLRLANTPLMVKLSDKEKSYLYGCIEKLGTDLVTGFIWEELVEKLHEMNEKFHHKK